MKIFPENAIGEKVRLVVENSNTIRNVKAKIQGEHSLAIPNKTTLLLEPRPFPATEIYVKSRTGEMIALEVENSGTIRQVTELPSSHAYGAMQIFVLTLTGERTMLEVEITDTVGDVKFKVYEQKGLAFLAEKKRPEEHSLVFNEKRLKDGCTLADYNVQKYSTFLLRPRLHGGVF